jgi:4-alpha-glucanotransferase
MTDPIAALAGAMGILPRYTDQMGGTRETGRETALALLRAMGMDVTTEAQAAEHIADRHAKKARRTLPRFLVLTPDAPTRLPVEDAGDWVIALEDGPQIEGRGPDLPPLPLGRHVLRAGGSETTLLVAPPHLPLPPGGWGVTAPLWGLRPPERTGFGDYDDLRRTGLSLARTGAGFLGINPIHAGFPTEPSWASPYSPSHRRRLNPLHIATGGGLVSGTLVDYATEIPAKRAALRAAYDEFTGDTVFDAFCATEGASLTLFAAHQALSERYGALWTDWPAHLHDPARAIWAVPPEAVRYHQWLQWMAHRQLTETQAALTAAGMRHGLYLDLAVGTHPAGAETWADRHWFAQGVSLGAPPDPFAPDGQRWSLAPLNPEALVAGHFAALADTLRQQMRYSRLIRIDHILGFDRAYWVPDEPGLPGAYVAMPRAAMLAVIRIEAARAGATVIGEDLGNIPDGLQGALAEAGILGCRLMQFERDTPPETYPAPTLAAFGTHDLPTFAGWADGADIRARHAIGRIGEDTLANGLAGRAEEAQAYAGMAGGTDAGTMHRTLARAGSALVAVQVEDVLGMADQTNLPGTIDEYPNWRRKLPVAGEALGDDPRLIAVAETMRQAGRATSGA